MTKNKFKFGDRVKVERGEFYKGAMGVVIEMLEYPASATTSRRYYNVELQPPRAADNYMVKFDESDLKLLKN